MPKDEFLAPLFGEAFLYPCLSVVSAWPICVLKLDVPMLLSLFVSEVTTKMMVSQQKREKAMDERMESSVSRTILTQMLHENRFSHRL